MRRKDVDPQFYNWVKLTSHQDFHPLQQASIEYLSQLRENKEAKDRLLKSAYECYLSDKFAHLHEYDYTQEAM